MIEGGKVLPVSWNPLRLSSHQTSEIQGKKEGWGRERGRERKRGQRGGEREIKRQKETETETERDG